MADPATGTMLVADVAEALRPGAGGFADDMVTLWRPWGFRIADVPPGTRVWHGAQDTRAEPDFQYLAAHAAGLPGAGLARRRTLRRRSGTGARSSGLLC